ncbi:MAG: ECF-type riboflavin transporter substrate-binding protein [Spirochaetales bacterium]|jgi:energy-coupling factor transport system substrate-specific component|nr:ECF-type riboflavin transporter substrate-binding protein [Spirochaetales bacterium]
MKKSPVILVVAIGIGAALFFVLGRFVAIPTPIPNTNFSLQYALLGFMAGLFGPIAGLLIAFIGHALIDFSYGWGIWWSWVIASAVAGFIMGLASKKLALSDEKFDGKKIIIFNLFQIVAHLVAWGVVAPVFDILIYAEPANKVFTQGLVAGASNIVTTAVVGTLLCFGYTKARPAEGSLKKED